jgi:hypothetical protein
MNEIITFGKGYKLTPGIKVFVKSATRFCDKLTIICSNLDKELIDFLKQNNVNLVDADEIALKYNVQTTISPYTLKVIFFYLYCKHYCESTNVYLCDFTDLCFQKNLFELIKNKKPYVTSENYLIANCQTNTTWINLCYNADSYNLLKKYEILNGGSILGELTSAIALLKEMCADMTQIISRIGNYQNIDQASLNKVVYFDQARYNILNKLEIANLAHFGNASTVLKKDKVTINNTEPYVLHQYDVIKPLEKFLYEQFN